MLLGRQNTVRKDTTLDPAGKTVTKLHRKKRRRPRREVEMYLKVKKYPAFFNTEVEGAIWVMENDKKKKRMNLDPTEKL